jgi:hypothetical protein
MWGRRKSRQRPPVAIKAIPDKEEWIEKDGKKQASKQVKLLRWELKGSEWIIFQLASIVHNYTHLRFSRVAFKKEEPGVSSYLIDQAKDDRDTGDFLTELLVRGNSPYYFV